MPFIIGQSESPPTPLAAEDSVLHLARAANLDLKTLAERRRTELRPFLAGPESRHDLTLMSWLEALA
jgi:hypothetical protein